jgi:CDP-glucose 4,6-dehydratase
MVKYLDFKLLFNGFFNDKSVLVTGHTGFKGSWLCLYLNILGAKVYGYALDPPTSPSLYNEAMLNEMVKSYVGDVRNFTYLSEIVHAVQPEIVIHMAAQPLVRESYKNPIDTYATNVMGTVHLLQACRDVKSLKAIVNVTTDKCYENKEWHWGYRENEPIGGYDPYSNSKACSELVTSAFRDSFFNPRMYSEHSVAIASARAGNVIGGGDWADDRLIPDFIRAISSNKNLMIRSPYAIRPWQHVMEPLSGYLLLAKKLFCEGENYSGAWNFGPDDNDAKSVEWIVDSICKFWGGHAAYTIDTNPQPHEANYLKLDYSKAKSELGWTPMWSINDSLESIVKWNKSYMSGDNMREITQNQICSYLKILNKK